MGLVSIFRRIMKHNRKTSIACVKDQIPNSRQNLLAHISKNDSSALIRGGAVFGLNPYQNFDLLAELAENDKDKDVRRIA